MSITPSILNQIIPVGITEDELYSWMDAQTAGLYKKAQESVNQWWASVVVALMAADTYYGVDTQTQRQGKQQPDRLKEWCQRNGLDNHDKIAKARQIARACLTNQVTAIEIIDELGVNNSALVGAAKTEYKAEVLLNSALNGSTTRELKELSKEISKSPEGIQAEIKRYEELLEGLTGHDQSYHNFNRQIEKLKVKLEDSESRNRCTEKLAEEHDVQLKVVKEAARDAGKIIGRMENAQEIENLKRQLADERTTIKEKDAEIEKKEKQRLAAKKEAKAAYDQSYTGFAALAKEDPLFCLGVGERKSGVQAIASEFKAQAVVMEFCMTQPDDGIPGCAQVQSRVVDAFKAWAQVLDPYYLQEALDALNSQVNKSNVNSTEKLTIIDV